MKTNHNKTIKYEINININNVFYITFSFWMYSEACMSLVIILTFLILFFLTATAIPVSRSIMLVARLYQTKQYCYVMNTTFYSIHMAMY